MTAAHFYYPLCALVFMVISCFYYFTHRRLPNEMNHVYSRLMIAATLTVLFDFISQFLTSTFTETPRWVLHVSYIIFTFSMQYCLPTFLKYLLLFTGDFQRMSNAVRIVIVVPHIAAFVAIIMSAFCDYGAYSINKNNAFVSGKLAWVLWLAMAFYLLFALGVLLKFKEMLGKRTILLGLVYSAIILFSLLIQLKFNALTIVSSATAFSVLGMYFIMLAPNNYLDSLTNNFNRVAFPVFANELYSSDAAKKFSFTLVCFTNFDHISNFYGSASAESALQALSQYLGRCFPRCFIFRLNYKTLIVMDNRNAFPQDVAAAKIAKAQHTHTYRGNSFARNIGAAYLQGNMFKGVPELLDAIDNIFLLNIFSEDESLKVITPDILRRISNRAILEADLPEIVEDNKVFLECQPITDMKRSPASYEVFPSVDSEKYREADAETIFSLANQTGMLKRLCYDMFDRIFAYLSDNQTVELKLEVAIPLEIFSDDDFVGYLKRFSKTKSYRKDTICLNLCNVMPSADIKRIVENVNLLADSGYVLAIDNFGAGYIDFDFLTGIKYKRIKITGSLLTSAIQGAKNAGYLSIIYAAIGRLNASIIQKGIDSKEAYSFASIFEVAYGQGSYLSKKMPFSFLPTSAK